jgi:DNA-binding response OmpR family regulator
MRDRPLVLVVEDEIELNDLERQLLALYGLDSVPAYTGTEALNKAEECNADTIILDLMLPELDGFETCKRLRERNGRRVPIVVVSALDDAPSRHRASKAGADAYFSKPFDTQALMTKVWDLVHKPEGAPGPA